MFDVIIILFLFNNSKCLSCIFILDITLLSTSFDSIHLNCIPIFVITVFKRSNKRNIFISDTAGEGALQTEANNKGNIDRVSTRVWAQSCKYDPVKLFTKLFHDDIKYLLSMDNLWKKRRPPVPLNWKELPDGGLLQLPQTDLFTINSYIKYFSTKENVKII